MICGWWMPPAVSMSWLISWSIVSFGREKLSSIAKPHRCSRIIVLLTVAQLVAQSKQSVAGCADSDAVLDMS